MADAGLVEVRLLGVPVATHQQAAEHVDDLLREFTHLDADSAELPARLLQLRDELQGRYWAFTAGPREEIRQAIEDNTTSVDVVCQLPSQLGNDAAHALRLLEEADEYCRQGSYLLTLAAAPDEARYRQWIFGQIVDQCNGAAPTRWSPAE